MFEIFMPHPISAPETTQSNGNLFLSITEITTNGASDTLTKERATPSHENNHVVSYLHLYFPV